MANEPSILDVADEEFAQINKPETKQDKGSILDIADDEFKKQEEESTQKEFDVAKLEKLKAEGKPLSEVQQRMIFDEQDKVPLLEQAAIGLEKFIPAAAVKVGELSRGAYELAREGAVKPVYVGAKYHLGLATPKETNIAARDAEIAGRSFVSGVASDIEETSNAGVRAYNFGTSFTDKLQGLSADERFNRYRLREDMRGIEQAWREGTPDRAAALLAENVLLQKAAGIATKMQGGNEEDAKAAEKAYSELVLESGLTREELNPYISAIGEWMSPISIPGANIATKTIGKYTGKAVQKGGELALKGVVKPVATGVEKSAEFIEKGITGVQTGAKKLGEYVTGDPDTLIRGGSIAGLIQAPEITGMVLAAKPATIATKEIARTFKDIASAVDVGGAAGRRGLVERAGRSADSGALTKRLFSAESRGGLGRARAADWMIRQGNAITQQGVNGAVLNTILGLPDIESIEQGFEVAGSGFGMGAFGGSRIMDRAGAIIDPRTSLAQKIDTIITPDPSSRRADEDADIKRFLSSVDPDLVPRMEKLGSIDERKKAIQTKIDDLEKKKDVTFGPDVQDIKSKISKLKTTIETLDKATPQTQKEILRQVHLAFAEEMDLAKTTGKAAGLNNIQVKILDPSEMEGFFRNSYGATLTDAESVISQLTGNPNLSPQESESLVNARKVVDRFYNEVGSLQSARGGAISDGSETPAFMRKQNLQGATIVINGDLVKQLSGEGFNVRNVVGHEMQHALSQFSEVRDMLAPIRRELFDQNIVNEDGTINKVTRGVYSDEKLDAYANTYAAAMSPSDNGESFKAQFGDQDKLRAYIKEEVLSEIAGRSGRINGGKRAGLDSIGRQVVDWIEVKTQNGVLKTIKETLRKGGIIVDDSGDISTVLGAELTPESLAMIRQYQRQLNNLNQSMVYEGDARKEEVEIPLTKILSDRSLQEKFKNSDIFEKEQVATMTAPDGSKQEIPLPPEAGVDPFVGTYRIQGGQLVDEKGIPMNLGPEITFGTMPDGTQVEVGTRIARNVDGSPKILSNREIEARSRNRGKVIRNAIDSALSKGALQLEDTGNGNYRGVMSETQVNAVLALPNTIVSPNLKRQILFVNEILRRKDGTRMYMEYQAAMRGGKSRALAPQIRDEIPIGFQFSKQGNFLITTISVSRMHDKMNAWLAKKPENLKLWNGDTTEFWSDVIKVLDNHSKGNRGETGLDTDAAIALEKKNAVNDLFNVWNADTKAANPRRTKLPVQKGKDPIDVIVRSRRIDRINQYNESALQKMPFNYELNRDNYMPAENPLADFQTPEDFANDLPSVTAEEIRNAINTGNLDQLESKLREGDDLKPAESLDEENGNIRIVSMFDPAFMPEDPMESEPEVSVSATQFMPAETERYPTSERGMYSGLQKTIDEKVTGKFASPDQLKAIVNNPQNAKAEELKWSGVLGEIDRLAAENQGKVPKDKVMDYLRNEGAVKFEEITLGQNNSIQKIADEYRIKIEDEYGEKAFYDEFDDPLEFDELPIRLQDAIDQSKNAPEPKHSTYQLPGGANYREVVMTMPIPPTKRKNWGIIYDSTIGRAQLGVVFKTKEEAQSHIDNHPDIKNPKVNSWDFEEESKPSYTSSHFPDTPNYVAHMRLNERTDAQGNDGLFVEEFQSDRHQAGREKGYIQDVKIDENRIFDDNGVFRVKGVYDPSVKFKTKSDALEYLKSITLHGKDLIPDAPFRKDWSIQLFKRALRDAVDADKKWIGWTTGIEQVKRYEQAMRQAVDKIVWVEIDSLLPSLGKEKSFIAVKDGKIAFSGKIDRNNNVYGSGNNDADGKQLSEIVGKEIANKIVSEDSGTAAGDDLTVGGEGMKGFYDQILPKEVGKYVAKMGGKVEKVESGIMQKGPDIDKGGYTIPSMKDTPIWRVKITPEMAGKVRGGQLQFMPADREYDPNYDFFFQEEKKKAIAKDKANPMQPSEYNENLFDDWLDTGKKQWQLTFNEFVKSWVDNHEQKLKESGVESTLKTEDLLSSDYFYNNYKNLIKEAMDLNFNVPQNVVDEYKNSSKKQPFKGIQFMPADSEYLNLAKDPERNREQLQRMVDVAAKNAIALPIVKIADYYGEPKYTVFFNGEEQTSTYIDRNGKQALPVQNRETAQEIALEILDQHKEDYDTFDPVTYDDQGNVIPLSKRFQTTSPDIRFMPAVAVVPERFTGTGEKNEKRRGRYVAPPEFWKKFDINEFERGGKFFDLETGEDVTDKTYATGTIDVTGKRPSLISDSLIDEMPVEKGRTWKTNLFRKSAGWKWISEDHPEIAAIGTKEKPDPVLISVEAGSDHFYTLKTDFPNGVQLASYPEQGNEPRLRPTHKGKIQLGNEVGRIRTSSGKEHLVYDSITIGQPQSTPAEQPTKYEPISARIRPLEGISAPTKVVGAKALSLGEIEPPVRGKAMLPDIELGSTISDSKKLNRVESIPNVRVIDKSIKTVNGSRYYNIVKDGEWYSIRISDHKQRSSQYSVTESLSRPRKSKEANVGMDTPHEINVVIDEPIKNESEASEIINKVLTNLPKNSIYRIEGNGKKIYGNDTIEINGKYDTWEVSYEDQDGKAFDEIKLTPDSSEKSIQSSDITTSAKPAPDAVIKPFSNALVSSAGLINFLPAFHGTPFDVDRFKLEKIGTGEGAQAYGWGIYFAQARSVAEKYREDLSEYKATLDGRKVEPETLYVTFGPKYPGYLDGVITSQGLIERWLRQPNTQNPYPDGSQRSNLWNEVSSRAKSEGKGGNLYKVDLDVKDEDLLDWDKPLSEQSEKVKSLITKIADQLKDKEFRKNASKTQAILARKSYEVVENSGLVGDEDFQEQPMSVFYNDIAQELSKQINTNEDNNVYTLPENTKATSEALFTAGIPGIRYLDGMSRTSASDTNRRDELLKEVPQLRKTLENNPRDWEMRKQFEDWLTASEKELAALEKQIKSAETAPTYNYVVFDENLIKILDKNDKPVQDELPRATGLQFMPADGVKKPKTAKKEPERDIEPDFTHSIGGKLPSKFPDRGYFKIATKPTEDNRVIEYEVDPKTTVLPKVSDISSISGEQVAMLEADRHNTRGSNMGGPLHPWLKSNQAIAKLPDGRGFKPVWANMTAAFVTRAKNIIKNTTSGMALIQLMKERAHKSNRKFVQDVMSEIDSTSASIPQDRLDALHVILELGAKNPAKHLKRYKKAQSLLKDNEITQSEFNLIERFEAKNIEKYKPSVDFLGALGSMKSQATKGNIEGFDKAFDAHISKYKDQDWYKKIVNKYKDKTFSEEASKFTFNQRGSAMDRIDGIPFIPSVAQRLLESMDFNKGKNLDIVAAVQLSKDMDAFAIYTGNDPKQEAKMSDTERYLRDQFIKNPKFRIHPSYDWMMLGPEDANNFILETPRDPVTLFPDYASSHPKETVRTGSKETIVGTMKKSKIPLILKK